jgi:hypothetical protein
LKACAYDKPARLPFFSFLSSFPHKEKDDSVSGTAEGKPGEGEKTLQTKIPTKGLARRYCNAQQPLFPFVVFVAYAVRRCLKT